MRFAQRHLHLAVRASVQRDLVPRVVYRAVYQIALTVVSLYWRVRRPKTYGVKVLLLRRQAEEASVLLIRHTYGSSEFWHLPGGGYRPHKESPEAAATREVEEELGLRIQGLRHIGQYRTSAQGKEDTVSFLQVLVDEAPSLRPGREVLEARWFKVSTVGDTIKVYKSTLQALALIHEA